MPEPEKRTSFRTVRNVSGFSRPMSVWDAFCYNFLTMGVIFPWTFLWGPASFPGGNLEFAIVLTLLAQIPVSVAYCFLATVLPVTGGDYIYQRFAFGRWGFVSVMSGFVIWILQWVALSGWLFATLGLAPMLLTVGVLAQSPTLSKAGVAIQTPVGVAVVSIILAGLTTLFLIQGMRIYVRVQKFLFAATVAAVLGMIAVFLRSSAAFASQLNDFVRILSTQIGLSVPAGLTADFVAFLQSDVEKSGFSLNPPFSILATLGIVPIVWTSLQWATYSVEQSTEIAEADRFRKQVFMLLWSAVAVAAVLGVVPHAVELG